MAETTYGRLATVFTELNLAVFTQNWKTVSEHKLK